MESSSITKKNKVLISGAYGTGNCGDELILQSLLDAFSSYDVTVLSQNITHTKKNFPHIAVARQTPSFDPIRILKDILRFRIANIIARIMFIIHIRRNDTFIFGGGGLLAELVPSVLKHYILQLRIANFFKKKILILGVGVGPLRTEAGKKELAKTLNQIKPHIMVRDQHSKSLLRSIGVTTSINVKPDLAFSITRPSPIKQKDLVTVCLYEPFGHPLLWDNNQERQKEFIDELVSFLTALSSQYRIRLLPFGTVDDHTFAQSLSLGKSEVLPLIQDPITLYSKLAESYFTITMRFHAGLLSLASATPSICIDTQFKSARLLEDMELKELLISVPDGKHLEGDETLKEKDLASKVSFIEENYSNIQSKAIAYTQKNQNEIRSYLNHLQGNLNENTL